ncbi:FAD dependent oxidoreductase [Aulographum hederae CBS 113979]|uniref:FAD dependent oxidoreductase n=1 Tax=Aulographum hederae CBS 113979 TaxID=1176131 RepID=A0A6G1HC87_9PEZI|nr:FAD dependent oxidoreductase [Aulographum hederae CBS 113979]
MDDRIKIPPGLPRSNPTESYWQESPADIASLRSTETLPEYADYVIVGSGISGAFIAYNILERKPGASVVMLEARTACSGATGRNGGHTKAASYRTFAHHASSLGTAEAIKIARLEHANIRATHAFAATHSISCESRPCDTVDIIYTQTAYDAGVKAVEEMQSSMSQEDIFEGAGKYGIHDAESTSKAFLMPTETRPESEKLSGSFSYEAGSISAYKFAIGVLKLCLAKGLNLQTNTPCNTISPCEDSSKGKWTIETPRGTIRTPTLILATNGYTGHLIPSLRSFLVPLRGQIAAHKPREFFRAFTGSQGLPTTYSFIYERGYDYMIQRPADEDIVGVPEDGKGDIIIGGGLGRLPEEGRMEFGETDDTVLNPTNSKYLKDCLEGYFGVCWSGPAPTGNTVKKEWTGIMGATSDGLPLVGAMPAGSGYEGVWLSAGFNGHGMVLCLKSAEALVKMVLGDEERELEWFPQSFRVSEERLEKKFGGLKDRKVESQS